MPRDQHGRFNANANAYISEQIRNEIQRFESVHPCIYTVYDLIELIPDQLLQNQLRDQVVCIEGFTVNTVFGKIIYYQQQSKSFSSYRQ
ncbi:Arf-GAP with GTPase, ANK repeat and PH domain-containing protein [Dirofilaria immitis]